MCPNVSTELGKKEENGGLDRHLFPFQIELRFRWKREGERIMGPTPGFFSFLARRQFD